MRYNGHNDHYQVTDNHSADCSMMHSLRFVMKNIGSEPEIKSARSRVNNNDFVKKLSEKNSNKEATFVHHKSKSNGKFVNRRKSIDCTYTLKSQSAKLYKLGVKEPEDPSTVLPPVVNPQNNHSLKEEGVSTPSGRVRRRALSGQDHIEPKPSLTKPMRNFKASTQTRTNFIPVKNGRSSSVDYSNSHLMSQFTNSTKNEKKSSFSSSNFSQRNSTLEQKPSSHTNSLKNENTNRPITANRNSFGNLQTTWHQNSAAHASKRPSFEPSSQSSDDVSRPTTDRISTPRPPCYKGFTLDKRTHSVCSISSFGSNDKHSARLNSSLGRRRASLPNAMMYHQPAIDFNSSPEFYKAINELPRDHPLQEEAINKTDFMHPPDRSTSSVSPVKEPIRRDLLQSIQEVNHENSFNLSFKLDSSLNNKNECLTNGIVQSTQSIILKEKEITNGNLNAEKSTDGNRGNKTSKSHSTSPEKLLKSFYKKREKETSLLANIDLNGNHLQTSESNSPQPDQSFAYDFKGEMKNTHTKQTTQSNNDEIKSHHLAVVGSDYNQAQFEEYFKQFDCFTEADDVPDISNVDEDDEDLCDEDFCRKRIIMWLMNVQTGGDAEQIVRDNTPPPSPEPGTQETAIVVIYQGNEKSGLQN